MLPSRTYCRLYISIKFAEIYDHDNDTMKLSYTNAYLSRTFVITLSKFVVTNTNFRFYHLHNQQMNIVAHFIGYWMMLIEAELVQGIKMWSVDLFECFNFYCGFNETNNGISAYEKTIIPRGIHMLEHVS